MLRYLRKPGPADPVAVARPSVLAVYSAEYRKAFVAAAIAERMAHDLAAATRLLKAAT